MKIINKIGQIRTCLNCGNAFEACKNSVGKFCSRKCQKKHHHDGCYNRFLIGSSTVSGPNTVKRYLLKYFGNICSGCMLSEWLGQPITVHVHYEDGNRKNGNISNVRLWCPNCLAQK